MEGVGTGGMVASSSQPSLAQEIALEQAHLDSAHRRLAVLAGDARAQLEAVFRHDRGGTHQGRFERDAAVNGILRTVSRMEVGSRPLLFGRIDVASDEGGMATFHIGRLGILDENLDPLVVDWRAPVAEPFYRATGRDPMGLMLRRHIEVASQKVLSLEDERFSGGDSGSYDRQSGYGVGEETVEPGPPGALLAALERPRDSRMSDMVSTIQREQDEIIRAPMRGVLVVQGGPGTGKTAVALHRAAYLLYTHRFPLETQGVLVVGPNPVFLRYIEHVLPSLGETGVALSSVQGLVRGVRASYRDTYETARIKGDLRMAILLRRAVRTRQRPIRHDCRIPFGSTMLVLAAAECAAFVAELKARKGTHNAKRRHLETLVCRYLLEQYKARVGQAREARPDRAMEKWISARRADDAGADQDPEGPRLIDGQGSRRKPVSDGAADQVPGELCSEDANTAFLADLEEEGLVSQEEMDARVIQRLLRAPELQAALDRMWPRLTAGEFLHDLFGSKVLIEVAGRGLFDPAELVLLEKERHSSLSHIRWSQEDVALVDEARTLLGSRGGARSTSHGGNGGPGSYGRYDVEGRFSHVTRNQVDDDPVRKYGYIVVDEAQGLSPMEMRVIARRSLSGDMTLAGDMAQAVGPNPPASWDDVMARMGVSGNMKRDVRMVELTVSYRTPREILEAAEPVLASYMPELAPPRTLRSTGVRPAAIRVDGEIAQGTASMIEDIYNPASMGTCALIAPTYLCDELANALHRAGRDATLVAGSSGVTSGLSVVPAAIVNGLEFDIVVVVEPAGIVDESPMGVRSLYVAMTRPTKALYVLYSGTLPELLNHLDRPSG
ncbi:MAG: HelD family protein [Acidimicrobiales bacterium]